MSTQGDSAGLPSWWILGRDMLLFGAGLAALFMELGRDEVRDSVLTLVGILLGSPVGWAGVTSLASAVRSRGGTDGSSQSSPAGPPSPSASP